MRQQNNGCTKTKTSRRKVFPEMVDTPGSASQESSVIDAQALYYNIILSSSRARPCTCVDDNTAYELIWITVLKNKEKKSSHRQKSLLKTMYKSRGKTSLVWGKRCRGADGCHLFDMLYTQQVSHWVPGRGRTAISYHSLLTFTITKSKWCFVLWGYE